VNLLTRIDKLDLRTLGVVVEKIGEAVGIGAGAAVLGHPAAAIAMLANDLGKRGREIPAGTMIMSGGVTEAVSVSSGDSGSLRAEGRSDEQKKAVIDKVTQALVEATGTPIANVRVSIHDVPKQNWGIAGVSAKEPGR
jgi:4-oxalocrotonate tautomerase family enzyme